MATDDERLLLGENRRALARLRAIHIMAEKLREELGDRHESLDIVTGILALTKETQG